MSGRPGRSLRRIVAVAILAAAAGAVASAIAVSWQAALTLTATAAIAIVAFGSLGPLVERLYSPETQRIHKRAGCLVASHGLIVCAAIILLARLAPGRGAALLAGLVVVPVAVFVEVLVQFLAEGKSDARAGRS